MSALEQAIGLVEQGRDPVMAAKNHAKVVKLLQKAHAEGSGNKPSWGALLDRLEGVLSRRPRTLDELGASKIVRLSEDATPIAPKQELNNLKVEWPGGQGYVRSIFATTTDGDPASLSRISVRISINNSDELGTTGQAPAHIPLIAYAPLTHAWFRLAGPNGEPEGYPVDSLQRWSISFLNEGLIGGPSITPILLFGYVRRP